MLTHSSTLLAVFLGAPFACTQFSSACAICVPPPWVMHAAESLIRCHRRRTVGTCDGKRLGLMLGGIDGVTVGGSVGSHDGRHVGDGLGSCSGHDGRQCCGLRPV